MAHNLGRTAVAYFDAADFTKFSSSVAEAEVTTWLGTATAVTNIMDLSLDIGSETVDVTSRAEASQGFASIVPVLANGQVTFDAKWITGDAFTDELVACWRNIGGASNDDFEIAMAFLDRAYNATTVVQGLVANFGVSMSMTQNLKDIQKMSVTLSISSNPLWYYKDNTP
jgi:hypothetical protein